MFSGQTAGRRAVPGGLAFGLALIGALSMLYYHVGVFMPRVERARAAKHLQGEYSFGNDFYPIWLTSREWLRARRDPYSEAVTQKIQVGLFGRPLGGQFVTDPPADYRTFAYPAFTDLLFWPLSEIPFRTVRIVWAAFLTLALAGGVLLWARALSWNGSGAGLAIAVLLTVCSYPELEGLYAGQMGLLVGSLLAASLLAFVRGQLLLAGVLMALTMIKPQMTVLAIFYLLLWSLQDWPRRKRLVAGFFATTSLLVAASLAVWPHWIQSWVQVVIAYPRYSEPPLASDVLGAALRAHGGNAVIVALLLAAIALAWRGRAADAGSHQFWLTLSLLLAITTVALLPGQSLCDQVILLPGILLLACRDEVQSLTPVVRALLAIGIVVLLWPYFAAVGLIALRPFLSPELFGSKAVFVLPLRTAAAFPFVVLGLLTLALRGTMRPAIRRVSSPLQVP
jgi:hypothetical protein